MKEAYTKPSCDVEEFKAVDIVTTSADDIQKGDTDIPFGE